MVLRLGATLAVPLRDQNAMLRAAAFADEFPEPSLEGGLPLGVAQAIERMLLQHEPFPMVVLDRHYQVLRTNEGAARIFARLIADPALARPGDADLAALLRSLFDYPGVPQGWRQPDFSVPSDPTLTLRFKRDVLELAFLTTLTVFNAPQNVTLEELSIESYFPLDDVTAERCAQMART
jgi:MmyB-like transcription regulator ligand binding domain